MSSRVFEYVALDRGGKKRRGTTRAGERVEAYRQIAAQGLTPVRVEPAAREGGARPARVKATDLVNFTHQFAVLIEARIPIADGLRSIAEQERNTRLAQVVEDIARRVEAGGGVSAAMDAHREVFGETYVETLAAAEKTGNMIRVLQYLAEMLERHEESRRQLRGALLYPAAVTSILVLATVFLIGVVVPRFADMFETRGVDLPPLTIGLLSIGESFRSYWWAYLVGLGGAALGFRQITGTPGGRLALDGLLHRIPAVRSILVSLAVARFTRVFGLCLSAGLNLIEALHLAGRASGRPTLQRDVERMVEQVTAGGRLSEVMPRCAYLPPMARRLLAAGEEAANLARMCDVVARRHERDAASLTKNISTVIEPVMVVMIASVVLMVALAIFLPMWGMVNLMG